MARDSSPAINNETNGSNGDEREYQSVWLHAEAAPERRPGTTAMTKQEILRHRMKLLAKQQTTVLQQDTIEVAEFLLGSETYAFELEHLREVCPLSDVTYIPCSPPFVVGVINLRGQIIPIIDLMAFLNIGSNRLNVFNKAIVLHRNGLIIGFLADEVIGARKINVDSLQSGLPVLTGLSADYLRGITQDRLVVLDAAKILGDPRLSAEQ